MGGQVPALNLFRVYPKQKQNLVQLLERRGLQFIQQIHANAGGKSFSMTLYFTTQPIGKSVNWVKQLQKLFDIDNVDRDNYAACVLIEWERHLYAASYGIAHFFVSRFSDIDFGINIAARLVTDYKIKNSREYGGVRTKSIETYQPTTEIAFEPGESVSYIRGIPMDNKKWGKTISCGQSVQARKRDLDISNAHIFCRELELALTGPVLRDIPRSTRISDPAEIKKLEMRLVADMRNGNYMVTISQQQLSGVDFLFSDRYEYSFQIDGDSYEIDESLDLDEIAAIVSRNFAGNYLKLLKTEVVAAEDGDFAFARPFIAFIDYLDSKNNIYLDDGDWFIFDRNYLSNVRLAVDRIPLRFSREIPIFDERAYQDWLRHQDSGQRHYRERYLNDLLAAQFGYKNRDRDFDLFEGAVIEMADLVKDTTIYALKIGKPQKLGYAVDQAEAAVRVLERKGNTIKIDGSLLPVNNICLWFFIERNSDIRAVSEINSLIFLMKLANWRKSTLLAGLAPEIQVSYLRPDRRTPAT